MEKRKLTELQLEECKRVFAISDRDGSGTINTTELRTVLQAILGEVPSDDVLQKLFALMDANGDGQISLEEFLSAMGDWLGGDEFEKRKKPQTSFSEERMDVHQQIKGFFQQFSVPDNFSAVRQALKEKVFRGQMTMDQMEENDSMMMMGVASSSGKDDSVKLAALNYANDAVLNFSQIMGGLSSNNPFQQLEATKAVCELLSLVVVFGTPLERRSITSVLVKIFHLCYEGGVMQRVMSFLDQQQQPPLQFQALKALTLYIPGPRIASTPPNHDLHPDKMLFKRHVKNAGAIRVVYMLLDHSLHDIREQAVACLGAFAAQHPAARDYLLQNNGLAPLLRFAQPTQSVEMLRKVSFVLACMVGYTHPPGFQPDFGLVRPCLPAIATLTYSNDPVILRNTLAAMALVLPVVPEPNMLLRVLEVLSWQEESQSDAVMSALLTITEVIKMDNTQTRMLLEQSFMVRLRNLLKHRQDHVRLGAVECLSVLCQKGFQQALFDGKIIPTLLELLASDNYVRWKIAHLLRLVTHGTPQQVSFMVNSCDIIRKLCESLTYFKQYDTVLSKVYKYMGPSYNFTFVFDIVSALHNITNVGFLVSEQTGENNVYALRFSMGDIDNIKGLLSTLASNQEEEAAWRKASQGDQARGLEELIAALLFKIKKANDRSTSSQSQVIVKEVMALWQRFFGKTQQVSSDQQIYFKCILGGVQSGDDIRIVEARKNISFAALLDILQLKYHRRLVLRFRDVEGDLVVLDSEGALHRALEAARNNTVVLSLQEVGDLMDAGATAAGVGVSGSGGALDLSPVGTPKTAKKRTMAGSSGQSEMNTSATFDFQNSPHKDLGKGSLSPRPVRDAALAAAAASTTTGGRADLTSSVTGWMQGIEHVQTFSRGEHIEQIRQQVGLSQQQIERLKSVFEKLADADGYINRYKFAEGLRTLGITSDLLIEQNWNAFDEDRDGRISIKEFITAVGIMSTGSTTEKLRFVFNMYDADGNGELDKAEVADIFRVSASLKGTFISPAQLKIMVDKTFDEIDLNKNGTIDFEEFVLAIQRNQLAVNTRVAFV